MFVIAQQISDSNILSRSYVASAVDRETIQQAFEQIRDQLIEFFAKGKVTTITGDSSHVRVRYYLDNHRWSYDIDYSINEISTAFSEFVGNPINYIEDHK